MEDEESARLSASGRGLVGREDALAAVRALLAGLVWPDTVRPSTLVISGEAGCGKTAVLTHALNGPHLAGGWQGALRVLRADGDDAEADLAYAALTQLLGDLPELLAELPEPHQRALLAVMSLSSLPRADQDGVHAALLRLLVLAARDRPVVLAVDDADRLDLASLRALLFLARRIRTSDRIGLLLAGRGQVRALPPDAALPAIVLEPLSRPDAQTLLDALASPPRGRLRLDILEGAEGNPAALLEMAAARSDRPTVFGPVGRGFLERLRALPPSTRRLSLHAAAADGQSWRVVVQAAGEGPAGADLALLRSEGLVTAAGPGVRFSHPLARSAAYTLGTASERRRAHLALAELDPDPVRSVWQRARASFLPDDALAAELADIGDRAEKSSDAGSATRAFERAAELSTDPGLQAVRYGRAVITANATGEPDWALAVHDAINALDAAPPALRAHAAFALTAALLLRGRQRAALRVLIDSGPAIADAADDGASALRAILASNIAEISGLPEAHLFWNEVKDFPAAAPGASHNPHLARRAAPALLTVMARTRRSPYAAGEALRDYLATASRDALRESDLLALGQMAHIAHDIRRSLELLGAAHASGAVISSCAISTGMLALDLVEHGEWDRADQLILDWSAQAQTLTLSFTAAELAATRALLRALRGDAEGATADLTRVRELVDLTENTAVDVRLRLAAGTLALLLGDRAHAFRALRGAFTADGSSRHPMLSHRLLTRLAASANSEQERNQALSVLERAREELGAPVPGHVRRLLHHAEAILGPDDEAEHHFRLALTDPAGEDWPLERAAARLNYGQWLRRRRRPIEARALLGAAHQSLQRLGAFGTTERVLGELQAAGATNTMAPVPATRAPAASGGATEALLATLTPQQRQIVHLAAKGLRNREIADRLSLSPRTVGSHLHAAYPKLGVSGRNQLATLLRPQGPV